MIITELWRYPVKSMQGERLERADIGPDGIHGDRAWSLVDPATGANLTARREPALLNARAAIDGGALVVTLGDGTRITGDPEAMSQALSDWIGRPVRLQAAGPEVSGTYETQGAGVDLLDPSTPAEQLDRWYQWTGPTGSFHDSTRTKVSVVSTATLGQWDRRRFRINVITDGEGEDDFVDHQIRLGDQVVLDVRKQIDRCIMVTRPQASFGDGPVVERDLSVLTTINAERASMLGIGGLVAQAGTVEIGDRVELLAA